MDVDAAPGAQNRVVALPEPRLRASGEMPSLVRRSTGTTTKACPPTPAHDGATVFYVENEPLLIERLQAFGLIEPNGKGGWQLTECCNAGLAALPDDTDAPPNAQPAVIRPWRPRKL